MRYVSLVTSLVVLVACGSSTYSPEPRRRGGGAPRQEPDEKRPPFSAESLKAHIQKLSSDEFEGRAPGTVGEEKTVQYLSERFRSLGLAPGNPDGTYVQKVPMVGITAGADAKLTFRRGGASRTLAMGTDVVAWTKRVVGKSAIDSDLVFVGYGSVAPEYQWDDFKDVDVQGKVLVMLVGDPPGDDIFGGRAMTYYGRWTYKYEIASQRGAAGALIVHETGPAGYPWDVVRGSWTGEQFDLVTPDKNANRVAVEGWIQLDQAKALFAMAGLDWDEQRKKAVDRTFKPVPLGVRAQMEISNSLRTIDSVNVVAKLEGTTAKDEWVLYVAHWDHLGRDGTLQEDQIFNGAIDNASGTAGLLALAEAFKAGGPLARSVAFLAVTGEEQGLLGSRYYAQFPLHPPEKTVAVLNMDAMNVWGSTRDMTVVGMGQSSLDDLAATVAKEQGRVLRSDPEPEKGFYYRSDHFEFAKAGIPAFYPDGGVDFVGKPDGWGIARREKYDAEDYHKPSDDMKGDWDLAGALQDLELLRRMGERLAAGADWPAWSASSEFRARREAQRKP